MNTSFSRDFTSVDCYKCGVIFFVPTQLDTNRRDDKGSFWCPNGHAQSYTKSRGDILAEKLERKESELYRANQEKARLEKDLVKCRKGKKK